LQSTQKNSLLLLSLFVQKVENCRRFVVGKTRESKEIAFTSLLLHSRKEKIEKLKKQQCQLFAICLLHTNHRGNGRMTLKVGKVN
jgi:hypothetical protein